MENDEDVFMVSKEDFQELLAKAFEDGVYWASWRIFLSGLMLGIILTLSVVSMINQ